MTAIAFSFLLPAIIGASVFFLVRMFQSPAWRASWRGFGVAVLIGAMVVFAYFLIGSIVTGTGPFESVFARAEFSLRMAMLTLPIWVLPILIINQLRVEP